MYARVLSAKIFAVCVGSQMHYHTAAVTLALSRDSLVSTG